MCTIYDAGALESSAIDERMLCNLNLSKFIRLVNHDLILKLISAGALFNVFDRDDDPFGIRFVICG